MVFHAAATGAFLTAMALGGASLFTWLGTSRWNLVASSSPIAFHLVFLFGGVLVSSLAGHHADLRCVHGGYRHQLGHRRRVVQARESIKAFSFAYFVPVYFAIVGAQLDLLHSFQPWFFCWFVVFACVVKTHECVRRCAAGRRTAAQLPVHRVGDECPRVGPGIVLASVAFGAGIVSEQFYTSLVLLAIVTSVVAGTWLGRVAGPAQPSVRSRSSRRRDPGTSAAPHQRADGPAPDPFIRRTARGHFWWRRPNGRMTVKWVRGWSCPERGGSRCATHRAGRKDQHGLRVGVAGIGYWGSKHVRTLRSLDSVSQVVVIDPSEERVAKLRHSFPEVDSYPDLESALPAIDALVVATPPSTHAPLACAAIEAGKHVLVEKPFATRAPGRPPHGADGG